LDAAKGVSSSVSLQSRRLIDAETVTLTSAKGAVAAPACVEIRRYVPTGEFRYRIKLPAIAQLSDGHMLG
jgi:hypothetical protein